MRVFRYLIGAALAMFAAGAFGQAVTVNGVITDSDGNNWDNGYWSATLISPNGDPMYLGTPLSTANFTGALDSNGTMISSGQFYANGTIAPTGSFYEINMCSATTAPCSTFNLQVVDGPSFVTAINAAITAPRFPAFVGALGYSDAELMLTPIVGSRYFNSNTATFRYWDGSAFVDEGGGGVPYDPTNVAITGGSIANVTQTGGTINGTAIGSTTPSLGYFTQLGATNILINCTVGTGGVTANHLVAYISGTGMCANALVSATNVIGIAQLTVSSGGTSRVSQIGNFTCLSQGNWLLGDLLTSSASVAGACVDTGQSNTGLVPSTTEIVGKALTACTSGSTCSMNNIGPGHFGRLYPYALNTLVATTPSIGGSLLTVGCTAFTTIVVASAATNMTCVMSGVAGNPANIQPQCSVLSPGVVTPQLCTSVAVTPTAQTYNIRVIQ